VFINTIIKDHKEVTKCFSSTNTQRNILEKAAQQKTQFPMFKTNFETEKVSIVQEIQNSMVKGTKQVTFDREQFILPLIRDNHLTANSQGLTIYMVSLLQVISANHSLANQEVNSEATKKHVIDITADPARFLTTNAGRRQV